MDDGQNAMRALINEAHRTHMNADDVLWSSGYRLDPYPNGTSKDELIARIETVEAERDKTRNLLRKEHEWYVKEAVATENGTMEEAMEWHRRRKPTCSVCAFLAETSTVKP
jgi:hypothetical protein